MRSASNQSINSPKGKKVKSPTRSPSRESQSPPARQGRQSSDSRGRAGGVSRASAGRTPTGESQSSQSSPPRTVDPHQDLFGDPGSSGSVFIDEFVDEGPRSSSVSSMASRRPSPALADGTRPVSTGHTPPVSRRRSYHRLGNPLRRSSSSQKQLLQLQPKGISLDGPLPEPYQVPIDEKSGRPRRGSKTRRMISMDSVNEEVSPTTASPRGAISRWKKPTAASAGLPTAEQTIRGRPSMSSHVASTLTPPRARAENPTPRSIALNFFKRKNSVESMSSPSGGGRGSESRASPSYSTSSARGGGVRWASPSRVAEHVQIVRRRSPSPSHRARRPPPPKKSKSSSAVLLLLPQNNVSRPTPVHDTSGSYRKKKPSSPRFAFRAAAAAQHAVGQFKKSRGSDAHSTPSRTGGGGSGLMSRLAGARSSASSSRSATPKEKLRAASIDLTKPLPAPSLPPGPRKASSKATRSQSAPKTSAVQAKSVPPAVQQWLKHLNLHRKIRNPKKDLANGVLIAEILHAQLGDSPDVKLPPLGILDGRASSTQARRENWRHVRETLASLGHGDLVSDSDVDAITRMRGGVALSVLDKCYAQFCPQAVDDAATEQVSSTSEASKQDTKDSVDLAAFGTPIDESDDAPVSPSTSSTTPPASPATLQQKLGGTGNLEETNIKQVALMHKELFRTRSSILTSLRPQRTPRAKVMRRRASMSDRSTVMRRVSALEENVDCVKLERLQRGELVGRGRFSSVYHAWWTTTATAKELEKKRTVAAKEFVYNDDEEGQVPVNILEVFEHELDICRRVRHPNVVNLLGMVYEPRPIILLEFMEQGSLKAAIYDDRESWASVSLTDKYQLMHDAAEGLRYLHEDAGVLHRDIKSHNILLNRAPGGRLVAKIGDLGSAMFHVGGQKVYEEIGTSGWTAPEVYTGAGYSFPADVWSLGVLMWEILATNPINEFAGLDSDVYTERITHGDRWVLPENMDRSLRTAVTSCWDLSTEKRPPVSSVCFTTNIRLVGSTTTTGNVSIEPSTPDAASSIASPRSGALPPPHRRSSVAL
eukprot:CAMPEP_0118979458 /NCGR_PEP_ID=MMETSP1173-20130426/25970_1 /TAXON_ID=1034831 /ORGANISM="Rhizochromulina marina cf, Strain CCMP1243" /LENGTH=1047 /DNA_ID=CAMNT_0006929717 /DNA_START=200 /DNA_END=3343 /DNA_ORIENTATION=-